VSNNWQLVVVRASSSVPCLSCHEQQETPATPH